jgi:hypothetical protein
MGFILPPQQEDTKEAELALKQRRNEDTRTAQASP